MTELNRKEALRVKMQSICRRHENGEPLDEDERYIFMDIEYLNLHETTGRNIHEFLDLADNLNMFDRKEEGQEVARLKERIANLEEQLRIISPQEQRTPFTVLSSRPSLTAEAISRIAGEISRPVSLITGTDSFFT